MIFMALFLFVLNLVFSFLELLLRIFQTINPEEELIFLKENPDYFQAIQLALMHGTNFKDLIMGMTFTYFAYFLTINSHNERKNRSQNEDPFR